MPSIFFILLTFNIVENMQVFKFGGSSIRDADGIKNLSEIVSKNRQCKVVVISALGKTTNALEDVFFDYYSNNKQWIGKLETIKDFHIHILSELIPEKDSPVYAALKSSFSDLENRLMRDPGSNLDKEYDQIVSFGELWSSVMVESFLNRENILAKWIDSRDIIITDDNFREANLSWDKTEQAIKENIDLDTGHLYVIQGFVGGTPDGSSTTLGREGSDFTAAILGSILNAESVTLWKDVQGILNADPSTFDNPEKLEQISYLEAVELAFFGAKVIHPKTIKPLYNKHIPLFIKSFINPDSIGTIIHSIEHPVEMIPVFVKKEHQILVSLRPRDLSFMIEQSFGQIFSVFNRNKVKINLVQTSATTLSICADNYQDRIDKILEELNEDCRITFNHDVQLVTIRHYTDEAIHLMIAKKQVLIEQKSRQTVHFVLRENQN